MNVHKVAGFDFIAQGLQNTVIQTMAAFTLPADLSEQSAFLPTPNIPKIPSRSENRIGHADVAKGVHFAAMV